MFRNASGWIEKLQLGWAKRAFLISMVLASCILITSLFKPNIYRSEVRILPGETKGSGIAGGLAMQAAAMGLSIPGQDSSEANYLEILNSRWLKETLLQEPFIYHKRNGLFGKERACKGTLLEYLRAPNLDRGVAGIGRILSSSRDNKSKMLTIIVETTSPDLCQQVGMRAATLLETCVQQKIQTRGSVKVQFTEARLKEAREDLEKAEQGLMKFLEGNRNYLVSADPSVRVHGLHLESELKLRQQIAMTLATSKEQALLDQKNDMPILNILDPANRPIEKSGPARLVNAIYVFVAAFAALIAFENRKRLIKILFGQ